MLPHQIVIMVSEHGCETLVCNTGAPLSIAPLPAAAHHVVCCWQDGVVACYKRQQLFAVAVWTLQLQHTVACMCTHHSPAVVLVASVGGSCR